MGNHHEHSASAPATAGKAKVIHLYKDFDIYNGLI